MPAISSGLVSRLNTRRDNPVENFWRDLCCHSGIAKSRRDASYADVVARKLPRQVTVIAATPALAEELVWPTLPAREMLEMFTITPPRLLLIMCSD